MVSRPHDAAVIVAELVLQKEMTCFPDCCLLFSLPLSLVPSCFLLPDLGGIESFSLIDADSDEVFGDPFFCDQVTDSVTASFFVGDVINYSVEANTVEFDDVVNYANRKIDSVKLCLMNDDGDGGECRCEVNARWALFGNSGDNFHGRPFVEGSYTVEATPYDDNRCGEDGGKEFDDTKTFQFTVLPRPVDDDPPPAPVDPFAHCEQPVGSLSNQIAIQELQSPAGPRHSDGIVSVGEGEATSLGFVWFDNDIVVPVEDETEGGKSLGVETGHCIQVHADKGLACYFNFNLTEGDKKGRVTAEALFDLTDFPNANLVITGGTGDFKGIVGHGCTSKVPGSDSNGTTFIYTFDYDLP
jgi:hypothetical protein